VLRLFILLSFLFFNLFACQDGYKACINKVQDSHAIQNNSLFIPVGKTKRIVYAKSVPNSKILKQDPFLSLYLVEDKRPFAYPFTINMRLQLATAAVNELDAKEGKFLSHQIGLNSFAKYSKEVSTAFIITNSCCNVEGIHVSKGVIEKEYIKHFITVKSSEYGDIGIRVKDDNGVVVVNAVDPFMKGNVFHMNDCIVAYDGKKIFNAAGLMRKILFSKIGTKHKVKIKRANRFSTLHVRTEKRYGGGYLSDTFFERKGLYFDKELHIMKLSEEFRKRGIKNGDKLVQVNGVNVSTQSELRGYLQKMKNYDTMLFERNSFQFFVKIK
jgi:hypothetical protein